MNTIPPLSEKEFGLYQDFLIKESGLYFDKDHSQQLCYALWDRMRIKGFRSYQEYYDFLTSRMEGQIETHELLDTMTTGETYFFRGRSQFDVLMQVVLPEIIDKKMRSGDQSLRVWSAGCSRGDEAYSIAIAVMEAIPNHADWDISILGTDINRNALISAKEAIYERKDLGHSYPEYVQKYMKQSKLGYVLDEEVKKIVTFEYHNLAKDAFTLDRITNLDLLFCRNVTIYFDPSVTKNVINEFYNCLNVGGFLFLGHAETLWYINNEFQTLEFPQTFIYKKTPHICPEEEAKPAIYIPSIRPEERLASGNKDLAPLTAFPPEKIEKEAESQDFFTAARELSQSGQYAAALEVIDKIIDQGQNQNKYLQVCLAKANILANLSRYDDAISLLKTMVVQDNLSVDAYYLLGVLLAKTGKGKEAETQFRKVIYIDPGVAIAYFNIGHIYLSQKDFDKAAREFGNAVKILQKNDKDERIKFCEEYTVEFLLRACKSNIIEMTRQGWGGA